jgi:TRAP-type C4-dicarboxylate transport system substrate-binding protein
MLKNKKLLICLLFLLMIFGSLSIFATAQEKTLKVQVLWGPVQYSDIMAPWVEDFNDSQKGNIQLKVYTAGELVSMQQTIPAVQSGAIDIAQCMGAHMGAPIDVVGFESAPPFAWNNSMELLTLWEIKGMKEIVSESWEALGGIKVFGHTICDPLNLITKKPIKSIEDLKGLKISGDPNVARILKSVGVSSITLSYDDLYLSAETGIIDGIAWGGATECYSNSWYEVCPYFLTNPICGAFTNPWLINDKVWNSLSPSEKKSLEIGLNDLRSRSMAYYYNGEAESLKYFKTTTLPAKDWDVLRQFTFDYWDKEIAPISERAAKLVKIIKDYSKEVEISE